MFEDTLTIPNQTDSQILILVEPWAFEISIPAGSTSTLHGKSDQTGGFEIDRSNDQVVVWGWPGCVLVVELDGEILHDLRDIVVPSITPGMTTRGFIQRVFGKSE